MSTQSKSLTGEKKTPANKLVESAHHLRLTETWEFLAQSSETESFRPATGLSDCVVVQKIESNHHSLRRGTVKVVRRSPATRLFRTPVLFLVFDLCLCFFVFLSRVRLCERNTKNVYDPSAGSPTETLLRLLLPLDSQVRPSSQRSARAVGRPRRGRSEGLTKPSNR